MSSNKTIAKLFYGEVLPYMNYQMERIIQNLIVDWKNEEMDMIAGDYQEENIDEDERDSEFERIQTRANSLRTFFSRLRCASLNMEDSTSKRGLVFFPKDEKVKEIRVIEGHSIVLLVYDNSHSVKYHECSIGNIFSYFSSNGKTCSMCGVEHKKYGLEAEILAMENDNIYRESLLRKLNRKLHLSTSSDNFGIDGSGVPLEIRNINSNTVKGVVDTYNTRLKSLLEGLKFFSKNFPYVKKDISFKNCGIHVHQFHPELSRDKLSTAHTLIGLLVNSFEPASWGERLGNGYGTPFNFRYPVPWCSGDKSTELRMFNVLHPNTLYTALELTNALAPKIKPITKASLDQFARAQGISYHRLPSSNAFTKILGFFISKEIITLDALCEAYQTLKENYRPVLAGKKCLPASFPELFDRKNIEGFLKNLEAEQKEIQRRKEELDHATVYVPIPGVEYISTAATVPFLTSEQVDGLVTRLEQNTRGETR